MFTILFGVLTYNLLVFGGVLPHTLLLVEIFWIAAVGAMLVLRFPKERSLHASLILVILLSGVLAALAPPKLAVGLFTATWAYVAAKTSNSSNVVRFFYFLLLLGVLEALLGFAQYFLVPGWILGYQSPLYSVSGTLINPNHFAGLLEMLVPISFGLAYVSSRRFGGIARTYTCLLAGAFVGLALLFSMSRMGIFSFLMTVLFLGMMLWLRRSQRRLAAAMAVCVLVLVVAGALWLGVDGIVARYSQLVGEEAIFHEGRLLIFQDVLRMIAASPWGVGTGNFQDHFRQYQTFRPDRLFDHAHNDYLETAAEWGLPVAAAFWSILIFTVIRGVRLFVSTDSPEQGAILLACTGAIFSILIHSLMDFNLQIPSNAMLFFTFVGVSLSVSLQPGGVPKQ